MSIWARARLSKRKFTVFRERNEHIGNDEWFLSESKGLKMSEIEKIDLEGDNLEVLKLLQRAYHGKIKMIYIDPPYNTGHDFVYKDNFGDTIANYKEQADLGGHSNAIQIFKHAQELSGEEIVLRTV